MFRKNRLKEKLRAGEKCLGCWLQLGSPAVAEALASMGFDGFIIDREHTPWSLEAAVAEMRALEPGGATLLLRVPSHDPAYFKRALDGGAEGVMVPNVETAEQALAVVAACRFPPAGIRGAAQPVTRVTGYGHKSADYTENYADELLIMCQIETARAVDNVAEIAAVEGVDMLFIGPNDLSGSIGKLSQYDDPAVRELLARAEAAITKAGIPMGGVSTGEGPAEMFERGYNFAAVGADLAFLRAGARAVIEAAGR